MSMDFKGNARRLAPGDVAAAAARIGVTEAHLRAVFEVETDGSGFDTRGRPDILPERHVFYRELSDQVVGKGGKVTYKATPQRDQAVRLGLAYPKWGAKPYPRSSDGCYALLAQMCEVDETAALKSCSWGLGQVMGNEYDEAGYSSVQSMVDDFCDSELAQLNGMCNLIKHRRLDDALRNGQWATFALHYNGSGYKKNRYDTRLKAAYDKWSKRLATPSAPPVESDDGALRVGSAGMRVKALQELLTSKGYHLGKADGDFGNLTRDAVNAWKADNGVSPITADGAVDGPTMAKIEASKERPLSSDRTEATASEVAKTSRIASHTQNAVKIAGATVAAVAGTNGADQAGLLDQAQAVADKAQQARGIWDTVKDTALGFGVDIGSFISHNSTLVLGVALVGVGVYAYLALRARVEDHNTGKTAS